MDNKIVEQYLYENILTISENLFKYIVITFKLYKDDISNYCCENCFLCYGCYKCKNCRPTAIKRSLCVDCENCRPVAIKRNFCFDCINDYDCEDYNNSELDESTNSINDKIFKWINDIKNNNINKNYIHNLYNNISKNEIDKIKNYDRYMLKYFK